MEKSLTESIGRDLFTRNIGVLSQTLQYYGFAHQGVFLMQNLWAGSRKLLQNYNFEEILKNVKQTIQNFSSLLYIFEEEYLNLKHTQLFKFNISVYFDDISKIIKIFDMIKDSNINNLKKILKASE